MAERKRQRNQQRYSKTLHRKLDWATWISLKIGSALKIMSSPQGKNSIESKLSIISCVLHITRLNVKWYRFVMCSRIHWFVFSNVMYCPPLQGNPSSWIWSYYIFCSYSGRMFLNCLKQTLKNTVGRIKYRQSGETRNIGYPRWS